LGIQKLGKWISALLFVGAVAAMIDLIGNFSKHSFIMLGIIFFQLLFSIVLYLSALKLTDSENTGLYKQCCWVGVFYALLLGLVMGSRQYSEFGFTLALPITTVIFILVFSSPFIWSIKKLNAM
jgi:hypothetical protein